MRKNILAIIFVFFSYAAFAGSSNPGTAITDKTAKDSSSITLSGITADSIDIKQMVLAQIEAAREKLTQDSIAALEAKSVQSVPAKAVVISQAAVTLKPQPEKTQLEKFFSYIQPVIQTVYKFNADDN